MAFLDYCRMFSRPVISEERMQLNMDALLFAITARLKSSSKSACTFHFHHDCFRFLFEGKGSPVTRGKGTLYKKSDFAVCKFPTAWDQYVEINGKGFVIQFPVKMQPHLFWSPKAFVIQNDALTEKQRMPVEKLSIDFSRQPILY